MEKSYLLEDCDFMVRGNKFIDKGSSFFVSVCGPLQINDNAIVVIWSAFVFFARIAYINATMLLRKTKAIGRVIYLIHT